MPPINILVKPASSGCNLKCKYCFYNDVAEKRDKKNYGLMSYDILGSLVMRAIEYGEGFVGFAFQGGEPTLAGLDFYRELIDLENKYNDKNLKINNAIQTNGILINKEWAEFLSENKFLVGLSLDGPKDIHDMNRVDFKGNGSHGKVEKTVELFNKYKVDYNILCVVTKLVAKHVNKVYNYYMKKGFKFLQFIPCLDELGEKPGKNPYSLQPEDYEYFLKRLFDLWYRDIVNGKMVSIRMFDNVVQMLLGYQPESCDMKGCCSANVVVEADGSVYPCDFYVDDEWKMGNIANDGIKQMIEGETAARFVRVFDGPADDCRQCEFLNICRGGCRRHYEPINDNKVEQNYFCPAYKAFYKYSLPRFYEVARRVSMYS